MTGPDLRHLLQFYANYGQQVNSGFYLNGTSAKAIKNVNQQLNLAQDACDVRKYTAIRLPQVKADVSADQTFN